MLTIEQFTFLTVLAGGPVLRKDIFDRLESEAGWKMTDAALGVFAKRLEQNGLIVRTRDHFGQAVYELSRVGFAECQKTATFLKKIVAQGAGATFAGSHKAPKGPPRGRGASNRSRSR